MSSYIFFASNAFYLAYTDYKSAATAKLKTTPFVFGFGALLFNSIFKISFHRTEWNIIDIIFAVFLLFTIIWEKNNSPFLFKKGNE